MLINRGKEKKTQQRWRPTGAINQGHVSVRGKKREQNKKRNGKKNM